MSRTEGINLPRLPARHARLTSSHAIQQHPAASRGRPEGHRRAISEPSYTAFVGSPRQDVPLQVYRDAAMFDDVFDKKGNLLLDRNTPKITSPLNSLGYSSLHDPHCRKLFLNNKKLRSHLVELGLITEDLKVVATISEQRQKIRAHELLERREQLQQCLEDGEQSRISKLQRQREMPTLYQQNMEQAERRRERAKEIQRMKVERLRQSEKEKEQVAKKRQEDWDQRVKVAVEENRLVEQARRNAARAQQEMAEALAYQKRYGKHGHRIAAWHRESDRIHNQMVAMQRKNWKKEIPAQHLTFESHFSDASQSTVTTTRDPTPQHLPSIASGSREVHMTEELTNQITEPHKEQSVKEPSTPEHVREEEERRESALDVEVIKDSVETVEKRDSQVDPVTGEPLVGVEKQVEDLTLQTDEEQSRQGEWEGKEREEGVAADEVTDGGVAQPAVLGGAEEEVELLDPEQGKAYLTQILIDMFNRASHDVSASGFISAEDYIKVLNSRDLGLQLNQTELEYLAEQSDLYKNGLIPVIQVVYQLPEILKLIYGQRAQQSMEFFGFYPEEPWCEVRVTARGGEERAVCYLNKLTGAMQVGGRPQDFRPTLREDAFEDSIVDFFSLADENRDGIIDYNDFCVLLVSEEVSSRTYNDQTSELLTQYLDSATNPQALMTIEEFAPLARLLFLMIYQNTYPAGDDWIALESRKYGSVYYNKITGETYVPSSPDDQPPATEGGEAVRRPQRKRKKRSRGHRRVSWSDDGTTPENPTPSPSQSAPPPLRRRQSREARSSEASDTSGTGNGNEDITVPVAGTRSGTETDTTLDSVPEESEGEDN